jgi:formate hydrogenlyase subunit 3/multisubunit Na+/H+ antiporter MnhD subunit
MSIVLTVILGLLALAMVGIATARRPAGRVLVYGGCLALCLALLLAGLVAMDAPVERMALPIGLPLPEPFGTRLRLDALSGFFLVLAGLGGAGASLFALGHGRHEEEPGRVLPFYPLFLAGMVLVVIADDAFTFLFGWEVMSLASWALVMAHHHDPANTRAGYVYLLMAVFSGLTLLLGFGVMAVANGIEGGIGGYAFDAIRANPPAGGLAATVLLIALIGTGAKAGLMPLHVWLPLAHPAAPSHVSALMSAVMTKVAIYGFIRIVFDLVGGAPAWFAVLVLVLGGITAAMGVLHAMMERDLKRLLAFSTVENVGIVFVALGLALAFRVNAVADGVSLALTAALFHALNHTVFKSLLFFGAGAVLHATGERDMDRLGGLIHRMPSSAAAMLVGCLAIAALPPLNGFASEWLLFQAVLLRPELPQWGLKFAIPIAGALLALAAALAGACFVRVFGITWLGRPRSAVAAEARETDAFSLAAMAIFAGLCLLGGIFPGVVIDALAPLVQGLTGTRMQPQLTDAWLTVAPITAARSSYNGLLIFLFVLASTLLAVLAVHRLAPRGVRRGPAWDCGFPDPSPATQYSADSFAQPVRRVFGAILFRSQETVTMPPPGDTAPASIRKATHDLIWDVLYAPLGDLVGRIGTVLNRMQFLTIRRYLSFVFGALIVLLVVLAGWQ